MEAMHCPARQRGRIGPERRDCRVERPREHGLPGLAVRERLVVALRERADQVGPAPLLVPRRRSEARRRRRPRLPGKRLDERAVHRAALALRAELSVPATQELERPAPQLIGGFEPARRGGEREAGLRPEVEHRGLEVGRAEIAAVTEERCEPRGAVPAQVLAGQVRDPVVRARDDPLVRVADARKLLRPDHTAPVVARVPPRERKRPVVAAPHGHGPACEPVLDRPVRVGEQEAVRRPGEAVERTVGLVERRGLHQVEERAQRLARTVVRPGEREGGALVVVRDHRTVPRHDDLLDDGVRAAHRDLLADDLGWPPLAVHLVLGRIAGPDPLGEEILGVHHRGRHAPGHRRVRPRITTGAPGVVTPTHSPPSQTRCMACQIDGRPSSRCGSLARSGRPEAVRAPETTTAFERAAHPGHRHRGRLERDGRPDRTAATRGLARKPRPGQLDLPVPRERRGEDLRRRVDVDERPRLRADPRQAQLERSRPGGDVRVDALAIRLGDRGRLRVRGRDVLLGGPAQPQAPRRPVELERLRPDELGEPPEGEPPQSLHLRQPVLRVDEAHRARQVAPAPREDVRDAVDVADHLDRRVEGREAAARRRSGEATAGRARGARLLERPEARLRHALDDHVTRDALVVPRRARPGP